MERTSFGNQMLICKDKDGYSLHDTRINMDIAHFDDYYLDDGELNVRMKAYGNMGNVSDEESIHGILNNNGIPDSKSAFEFNYSNYSIVGVTSVCDLKHKAEDYLNNKCTKILKKEPVELNDGFILMYDNGYYIINQKYNLFNGPFDKIYNVDSDKNIITAKCGSFKGEFTYNGDLIPFTLIDENTGIKSEEGNAFLNLSDVHSLSNKKYDKPKVLEIKRGSNK